MKTACEAFKTPVTGGNVSFYNQSSDEGPVFPTPTIGMLGIMEDDNSFLTLDFKAEGDLIYQIGSSQNCISSSEYLYAYQKIKASPAPHFEIEEELKIQDAIRQLNQAKLLTSCHDVADGGLFIALSESAQPNHLGFSITTNPVFRKDAFLFGEAQSRVVVSINPNLKADFEAKLLEMNVDFSNIGIVTKSDFVIDNEQIIDSNLAADLINNSLAALLQ
jgi:phosphoribosylformylglycinamidine synthase